MLPEPPVLPDRSTSNRTDALILVPHRNGDVNVPGNTLDGEGQIDLWEITPRTDGNYALLDRRDDRYGRRLVRLARRPAYRRARPQQRPGENGELVVTLQADTTYYFAVAAESGGGGTYDVHMTGRNQTSPATLCCHR